MKKQSLFSQFRYLPKLWAAVAYLLLFLGVFLLFLGRTVKSLRIPLLTDIFTDFYSHVSNFSISFMFCLVSGYMGIMQSGKMKPALIIGGLLLLANFIYEGFISVLNTPDRTDMYYGFVGALLPFVFFLFYRKWGLKGNELGASSDKEEGVNGFLG